MRVVSGKARGKKLLAVPGTTTRPILDRVKTALFDILRPDIDGQRVLDMFAGSGGVGIEALSQGASHCTFLDLEKSATDTIKRNLEGCGLTNQSLVRNTDAFSYIKRAQDCFDLIYIAPPQYKNIWIDAVKSIAEHPNILADSGKVIVQIDPKEYEKLDLSGIEEIDERKYGKTLLVFYRKRTITRT